MYCWYCDGATSAARCILVGTTSNISATGSPGISVVRDTGSSGVFLVIMSSIIFAPGNRFFANA